MTVLAVYDHNGRYLSTEVQTIIPEGVGMPPPHINQNELEYGVYEGVVDILNYYHDIGSDTPKLMPVKSHDYEKFDWVEKQWYDPRTLSELKDLKRSYINASRLGANQDSFTYLDQQIKVDLLSRGDIEGTQGVILLTGELPPEWLGGWKTVANTFVPIPDIATWTQFYLAMHAQGSRNFAHSQALKSKLALANTAEEIADIFWDSEG